MQAKIKGNRSDRKQDIPCKSMPNLSFETDCEGESSLNPYALEFIPSYLKSGQIDNKKKYSSSQKMKTEATSTTTLVQREVVGDASYLHTQRQLFELLHQLGDKFMPLKAIKVSLAPDGQGINVQFKAEHGFPGKQMLDESICQDAALHLEMSDRSFIPRRLPNVLAANFMVRMGDVLNDKMEWNESKSRPTVRDQSPSKQLLETKRKFHSSSVGKDMHHVGFTIPTETVAKKRHLEEPRDLTTLLKPAVTPPGDWKTLTPGSSKSGLYQRTLIEKKEPKYEKKSNTGIRTPRQSIGQMIKKGLTGVQKSVPRSTYTSQMRQTQVQKRLSLSKDLI